GAALVLVLIVWFLFRALTASAALSRALAVGDVARLRALADHELARTRRPGLRARYLVARALAEHLRGNHAAALAALDALDRAHPPPDLASLASVIRIGALVELRRPAAELPPAPPISPRAPALAWVAEAELAWHAGDLDTAAPLFARVID